jgi:regulator of RNase E activity RraA
MNKPLVLLTALLFLILGSVSAQYGTLSREELIEWTPSWEGERFPDGRPKVSDEILERMMTVTHEEALEVLRDYGFTDQFLGDWHNMHPEIKMVGRASTSVYFPIRPDMHEYLIKKGHEQDGRLAQQNYWPVDALVQGDFYVADVQARNHEGPIVGDNLMNGVYSRSGNGCIINGSARDMDGVWDLEGFNVWCLTWDSETTKGTLMLMGLNVPINIGRTTIMPGDVVLADRMGVTFIPPHLAEEVCLTSEIVAIHDDFMAWAIQSGKWAVGEIYGTTWEDDVWDAFKDWLERQPDLTPEQRKKYYETEAYGHH